MNTRSPSLYSIVELNELYFYTATVKEWIPLFRYRKRKDIIVQSLKYLVDRKKVVVYGFVVMPNHIHLLWEMLAKNGKESAVASFMKFTAHEFQADLRSNNPGFLERFAVESNSRNYQFWQTDALPIHVYTPAVIYQKLDYIHANPVSGKWMLADSPMDYEFSSANFYETGKDPFGFLTHIGERI